MDDVNGTGRRYGFAVRTFFRDVFDKHAAVFNEIGVDPNNGLGDLYAAIKRLPLAKQAEIEADIQACYANRSALAMVNSDRGITNLHVGSTSASRPSPRPRASRWSGCGSARTRSR
jgi:isocitrate dehydrogenase